MQDRNQPSSSIETFSHIPFKDRWEYLKPTIEDLRKGEGKQLKVLARIMKERYQFDANENQYKFQFRKWGSRQNLTAEKKRKIVEKLDDRGLQKKSGNAAYAVVKYQGKDVNLEKIAREIKATNKETINQLEALSLHHNQSYACRDDEIPVLRERGFFTKWRLPYEAIPKLQAFPSPAGGSISTPSEVDITTPPTCEQESSQMINLGLVLKEDLRIQLAQSFTRAKHSELVQGLNRDERKIILHWLYQFRLFALTTARHWGFGPCQWTSDLLGLQEEPTPSTPYFATDSREEPETDDKPIQLCNRSIHGGYESSESVLGSEDENTETRDTRRLNQAWPDSGNHRLFQEILVNNLSTSKFSNIPGEKLPISGDVVSKAASKSPNEMLLESISFAIIAGNTVLLKRLLLEASQRKVDISPIEPYHLAVAYLDGSRDCCMPMGSLQSMVSDCTNVNEFGHTIFDAILMRVLTSHSSIDPIQAPIKELESSYYWRGQETDICGRWNPTSPVYQKLLKSGQAHIPIRWKHKFCHTSIMAVIDVIDIVYPIHRGLKSGLYRHQCPKCGSQLTLHAVHSLVMTTWHLAQNALDDEDLFGLIRVLSDVIEESQRDPPINIKANISISLLLGKSPDACDHRDISAAELATALDIFRRDHQYWTSAIRNGWEAFVALLCAAEEASQIQINDDDKSRRLHYHLKLPDEGAQDFLICAKQFYRMGILSYGITNPALTHVWVALQLELLSHWRINIQDSWLSAGFEISAIAPALKRKKKPSMKILEDYHLKKYCECGWFEANNDGIFLEFGYMGAYLLHEDDSSIYED